MQLPLIKNGLVVNVVEMDEATACVSKPEYLEAVSQEDSQYEAALAAWRDAIAGRRAETQEAETQLFMAQGIAAAFKSDARKISNGDAHLALQRLLALDGEAQAWADKVSAMKAEPMPEKPRVVRVQRWIYPDGHDVGAPGGNIGDTWDGKAYAPPIIKAPEEPAEPVA